jgi:hypothetical protein
VWTDGTRVLPLDRQGTRLSALPGAGLPAGSVMHRAGQRDAVPLAASQDRLGIPHAARRHAARPQMRVWSTTLGQERLREWAW